MASGIVDSFLHSTNAGWSLARILAVAGPPLLMMAKTMFIGAWSEPTIETVAAGLPAN
jgi:hypothetical protein